MEVPAVSVVMPCYNVASYLEKAVESVVSQAFEDWELVLVDDGSVDGTSEVMDRLLAKYKGRQIVADRIAHVGCAGALKRTIELSTAPICTYAAGDDWLLPNSLRVIMRAFEDHPKVGFLWTRWKHTGKLACWTRKLPTGVTLKKALLSGWWGAQCQQAFRRRLFRATPGLNPVIELAADLQLAALFAELGCDTLHINEVTYVYRGHAQQSSHVKGHIQRKNAGQVLRLLREGQLRRRQ